MFSTPAGYSQDDFPKKRGMFGIRIGHVGSGTIKGEEKATGEKAEGDSEAVTTYGIYLDYPIMLKLYAGIAIDIAPIELRNENKSIINGGLTVKYTLTNSNSKVIFRPAVQVGYAALPSFSKYKSSNFITLLISGETIIKMADKFGLSADIGLFWGLSGGNNEYDVTGGSMLILRGGLVFL